MSPSNAVTATFVGPRSKSWVAILRFVLLPCALVLLGLPAKAQQTVTREVSYTYNPSTGLMESETVDPGGSYCVTTTYNHDTYGNRFRVKVSPCASVTDPGVTFTPRVTVNDFAASTDPQNYYPAGAYQTATRSVASDLNGAEIFAESRATFAPGHSTPLTQTEVALADATKNITKRTEYDGFGRVKREYTPVKRDTSNAVTEAYIEYSYGNYCLGAKTVSTPAPAACLKFAVQVPVDYASKRLVDAQGVPVPAGGAAQVVFQSAYFIESTPYNSANVVIGGKSRVHFDALHRQIAKESQSYDGTWVRTLSGFDALGLDAATWGAHFMAAGPQTAPPAELMRWTAARDNLHRPVEQKQNWRAAIGAAVTELSTQITYNGLTSTAKVPTASAPNGVERTVSTIKNAAGQTAQTINAEGATLSMAYDPVGNLVKTADALGYATTIQYTAVTARFKASMVDQDQGTWNYTYDALGQLKTQTDARGKVVGMTYDQLGRMVTKTTGQLNSFWTYTKNDSGVYCAYGLSRPCTSRTGSTATATVVPTSTSNGYDNLGRAVSGTSVLDRAYTSTSTLDDLARVATTTYPTGFAVRYVYSVSGGGKIPGVLERVEDAANSARVFWRIDNQAPGSVYDAQGHLLKAQLGNGVLTDNQFDPVSGKAFALRGGLGGSTSNVYDQRYVYDKANNLSSRTEGITVVYEAFTYDVLDRLTKYDLQSASDAGAARVVNMKYNALGNILEKGDLGGYSYSAGDKPHAVRSAGGTNYTYDANGNMTGSSGTQTRTQSWTDFNLPDVLSYQSKGVAFLYSANHQRIKETITDGANVRTLYLTHPNNVGGLGYEREETRVSGVLTRNENRHYITAGGIVIAVVKTLNVGSNPATDVLNGVVSADPKLVQYWHKDSLGSIIAVSDASGAIERMAFDAWGRRQRDTGRTDPYLNPAHGERGYTGHEHLDELGLIHMNGRVYDPVLARFLSADPILQSPEDLQNYNRYSYVLNNPLTYLDPSGHVIALPVAIFAALFAVDLILMGNDNWKMVGSVLLAAALGPGGIVEAGLGAALGADAFIALASQVSISTLTSSIAGGLAAFVSSGGDIGAAAIGAITAGAFTSAGIAGTSGRITDIQLVMTHAVIGCASQAVSGGKCGPGALSAAFGKMTTIAIGDVVSPPTLILSSLAGGTASRIGGGKFANGAVSAAMGYLFNHCTTSRSCWEDAQRQVMRVWTDTYVIAAKTTAAILSVGLLAPAAPEVAAQVQH